MLRPESDSYYKGHVSMFKVGHVPTFKVDHPYLILVFKNGKKEAVYSSWKSVRNLQSSIWNVH